MKDPILFLTSDTSNINDEGKQKTIKNLYLSVSKIWPVNALSRNGITINDNHEIINTNRFLFSRKFICAFRRLKYSHLVYLPNESVTLGTVIRITIISIFKPFRSRVNVVVLQHSTQPYLSTIIITKVLSLLNIRILNTSKQFDDNFRKLRKEKIFLTGVNLKQYNPIQRNEKIELREKYQIPPDEFIVLHVGHITKNRNIEELLQLSKVFTSIKFIIVVSSYKTIDTEIEKRILECGIILIKDYIEDISALYKLADIYLFMVKDEKGVIGMPLSVLEAVACGIPVVSRPLGYMPELFSGNPVVHFYSTFTQLESTIHSLSSNYPKIGENSDLMFLGWERIANLFIHTITSYDDNEK